MDIDVSPLSDAELGELSARISFEHAVRDEMRRATQPQPCSTIWGPGPPYYCVARCEVGPQGHAGRCKPNVTKAEARERYFNASVSFVDQSETARMEAVHRLGG